MQPLYANRSSSAKHIQIFGDNIHIITHGMQQISHSQPPGHGTSQQPVFGAPGFTTEEAEELEVGGRTSLTGMEWAQWAMTIDRVYVVWGVYIDEMWNCFLFFCQPLCHGLYSEVTQWKGRGVLTGVCKVQVQTCSNPSTEWRYICIGNADIYSGMAIE